MVDVGVGGLVGCGGWSSTEEDAEEELYFKLCFFCFGSNNFFLKYFPLPSFFISLGSYSSSEQSEDEHTFRFCCFINFFFLKILFH